MNKSEKKQKEEPLLNEKKESKNDDSLDKKEQQSVEEKLASAEEKLLRALAEMENQRRRSEKERQEAFDFGGFNFARESLSLIDNIDRAINSFKNDDSIKKNKDLNKIIEGIEIVKNDLISIFKKNGIEEIECLDKKFDPNYHQAMLEIENDIKEPGTVIQEVQKGYLMKDRLLRPSLVGVTKKREEKSKENQDIEEKNDKK